VNHRTLCRLAARWLLDQRWCYLAGFEVGNLSGVIDAIGCSYPFCIPVNPEHAAAWKDEERESRVRRMHRFDYLARRARVAELREANPKWSCRRAEDVARRETEPPYEPPAGVPTTHGKMRSKPVIGAAECKTTRADLMADLRASKMRRYEQVATNLFLFATAEALEVPDGPVTDAVKDAVLSDLTMRGLPVAWGVVLMRVHPVRSTRRRPEDILWWCGGREVASPHLLRTSRPVQEVRGVGHLFDVYDRIARALSYKAARGRMEDEPAAPEPAPEPALADGWGTPVETTDA
jgi:hypothetical protein